MSLLVDMPFVVTFSFARPVPGDCRNASGTLVTRGVNVPRFDHDAQGKRLGLIVGPGPIFGQHDNLHVRPGGWEVADAVTVLHEFEVDGVIRRQAIYTTRVRATVDACLKIAARHRLIGALPGFLPNLGQFVRFRAIEYPLGRALGVSATVALGDSAGRVLIES